MYSCFTFMSKQFPCNTRFLVVCFDNCNKIGKSFWIHKIFMSLARLPTFGTVRDQVCLANQEGPFTSSWLAAIPHFLYRPKKNCTESKKIHPKGDPVIFSPIEIKIYIPILFQLNFSRQFKLQRQLRVKNAKAVYVFQHREKRENVDLQTTEVEMARVKIHIFALSRSYPDPLACSDGFPLL